ncbi:MerR family transcriptional regulator [Nonomuraea sp. NPDC050153]|uniref:helix-turn-helix domain-containing protein n=1 Tax=Nonomuraea sp. NPDC050153 TaxID=3364359 RepID=UPI00379F8389
MSDTWSIGELAERAALALRASPDGAPPVNGRVRDVPGERLIRWYTTIGLVDPPLTRRGRIARYGRRHLLQLVAVKRLQAAGRSIAEIQAALAGATDRMLETAASLEPAAAVAANPASGTTPQTAARPEATPLEAPDDAHPVTDAAGDRQGGARADGEPGRGRFWAERPGKGLPRGAHRDTHGDAHGDAADGGAVVVGVRLGDGVRLVLDAGRVPSEEDVQAVLAAAGPLLAVLEERELV